MRPHWRAGAGAACAAASLAFAASAEAHGFYATPTVQIPPWMLAAGIAAIIAISFLAVARLVPEVRLTGGRQRPLLGGPTLAAIVEVLAGVAGFGALVLVVYAGLRGRREFDENFATIFVMIVVWVGLAVASAIVGDVYRLFNPWRAAGRAIGALLGRRLLGGSPAELPLPRWVGRLPAAAGLLAFGFLELKGGTTPREVALATLVYSALTWTGMALWGVERWCERGEAFAVYFGFFARLAPLGAAGGRIVLRRPLSALAEIRPLRGTSLVIAVVIGVVSFDGFSNSEQWQSIQRRIVQVFDGPFGQQGAARISVALGIVVMTSIVYGVYRAGVAAGAARGGPPPRELARLFAPALIPIALAYTLAHYMQYLFVRGQAIVALVSNPLGGSSNFFGTAGFEPNPVLSPTAYWYLEAGAIVVGHVAGMLAAHDLALQVYGDARRALHSQRWLVAIMIVLSVFALWLLAHASEVPFAGR